MPGNSQALFRRIDEALSEIKEHGNNIKIILNELDGDIIIPENATLRISYKQHREVEKLEFKIFWDLRDNSKLEANCRYVPAQRQKVGEE